MKTYDKMRMAVWLAAGLALYGGSLAVGPGLPAAQTVLHKLGHVTTLAWVGYWIARNAIGRVNDNSSPGALLARAVLMAGAIVGGSMGL